MEIGLCRGIGFVGKVINLNGLGDNIQWNCGTLDRDHVGIFARHEASEKATSHQSCVGACIRSKIDGTTIMYCLTAW